MTPLSSELRRLYLVPSTDSAADAAPIDRAGRVRALVLELAGPADWDLLAPLWREVQAELHLPAPGIAVSGTDALQLWFSLAEPVPAAQAHVFLEALRSRYLPQVDRRRVRLWPAADGAVHAAPVPAPQAGTDHWSAFIASDLPAVFADTPWLDIEPSEEGQAALLRALRVTKPAEFAEALQRLAQGAAPPAPPAARIAPAPGTVDDPRRFLRSVMNDGAAPLALRIEAAKVLLQHGG
ncbi:hypothetical protein [Xylophilus sp.]|uniref:hypothetical protein n=1 Tax=Xylophilus sp. TaxID=2653893 RepID=UPI0013B72093|nr:hypothetical protein [Xylophilus sp.]KAF1050200.1 MAG: hypothetical protein GAK38_00226 [Xylophilus sp.]